MSNTRPVMTLSAIVAVIGIFAFTSMPAWAEPADCTKTESGKEEKNPLKRCEEKLNDAQYGLIKKLDLLIDEMEDMPGMNLDTMAFTNPRTGESSDLKEHTAKMGRQQKRAEYAIAESSNDDFEEIAIGGGKQKGQACSWEEDPDVKDNPEEFLVLPSNLEYIAGTGLGNGDCDKFTAYDSDKGKNVQIRERSQLNICVRVCNDKKAHGQSDFKKDKIKGRYTERRSEGIDATLRANDALDAAILDVATSNAMVKAYGAPVALAMTFPECEPNLDAPKFVAFGFKSVMVPGLVALKITSRVLEGIKESGKVFCQQDVAGFNTSSACIPAIVADQVAKGSVDVVEFLIQAADLTVQGNDLFAPDANLNCARAIRAKQENMITRIMGVDSKAKTIDRKVNALKTQVSEMSEGLQAMIEENREYIKDTRELVLTPHGQRAKAKLYEPDDG